MRSGFYGAILVAGAVLLLVLGRSLSGFDACRVEASQLDHPECVIYGWFNIVAAAVLTAGVILLGWSIAKRSRK